MNSTPQNYSQLDHGQQRQFFNTNIPNTQLHTQMMDEDDYEEFIEGDLFSALYKALDRLEELDPETGNEPWFKLLESAVDKTLAPHIEKARKKLH